MKKKLLFLLTVLCTLSISGCQAATKSLGGNMTLKLEHTFQQSSEFGILEGTVTVVESKEE